MSIRPSGPTALLVDEVDEPGLWAQAFTAALVGGVVAVVPGERSVLIHFDPSSRDEVLANADRLERQPIERANLPEQLEHVIDVEFDGPDLDDVATTTGLTTDAVVDRFVAPTYEVAFCGFSPGFAYLRGLDPALHLPRRDVPRTRVDAGSVAIAAHYAAVYPSPSPGGWHLLGHTDAEIWVVDRNPPALMRPPERVRFRRRG